MIHNTRIDNLAIIMLDGIGTSNASRTIVGLRCDAGEVSHDGGRCAPLDFFIGCSIEVRAPTSAVRCSRTDIGGNNVRVFVTGSPESTTIPVRLCSVTFRIPSCQLDQWREGLRDCLSECIEKHGGHLTRKTKKKAKKQLWMLLAHRLLYDPRRACETGKYKKVAKIAHLMHTEIFEALRPLWHVTEEKKKEQAWGKRTWQHLPLPFQRWFQEKYGAAMSFFKVDPTFDTNDLYKVDGDVDKVPD